MSSFSTRFWKRDRAHTRPTSVVRVEELETRALLAVSPFDPLLAAMPMPSNVTAETPAQAGDATPGEQSATSPSQDGTQDGSLEEASNVPGANSEPESQTNSSQTQPGNSTSEGDFGSPFTARDGFTTSGTASNGTGASGTDGVVPVIAVLEAARTIFLPDGPDATRGPSGDFPQAVLVSNAEVMVSRLPQPSEVEEDPDRTPNASALPSLNGSATANQMGGAGGGLEVREDRFPPLEREETEPEVVPDVAIRAASAAAESVARPAEAAPRREEQLPREDEAFVPPYGSDALDVYFAGVPVAPAAPENPRQDDRPVAPLADSAMAAGGTALLGAWAVGTSFSAWRDRRRKKLALPSRI